MKSSFLIFILGLFLLSTVVHAQSFQWGRYENGAFTNIQNATVSDVSSDFGMRNAGTGATIFHRGVDIAPIGSQNVVLIAPFTGKITVINAPDDNIKTLEFASRADPTLSIKFLHIFPNGGLPLTSNGFRLEEDNLGRKIIVDMVNCRAYSATAGIQTTCNGEPVGPNNPAIETQDTFIMGAPIVPMGNSGYRSAGVAYHYHVHISQLENNSHDHNSLTDCIDAMHQLTLEGNEAPLSSRLRSRSAAPAIDLNHDENCEHNGNWGVFTPSYTNNTKNIVEVEVYMRNANRVVGRTDRYSNGFMNEYIIDSRIRATGTNNFELIQGSRHYSYFRMNPIDAEVIYPGTSYGGTGDANAGCSPYAYTEDIGFHPHDYYLFPNFYLRIHKNHVIGNDLLLANYPWEARYPDGDYQIRSSVINIDNVTNNGDIIDFDIDNFKPFVKEVGVNFEQVGVTVYWNSWHSTTIPSQLELGTRAEGGLPNLDPGSLTIYAVMSEQMQGMTAEIPSLNTGQVAGAIFDAAINKWRFTFNLASGQLQYGQCHKIIFRGRDLNNNQLLDFQIESQNPQVPTFCNWGINKRVLVPKRTDVNSWDAATTSGMDQVHRFRILECGSFRDDVNNAPLTENTIICEALAGDVSADIHFASGANEQDGSIILTVSGNPDVQTIWYNTERQEIGQGLEILNLEPGLYCYEMKIECCVISDCFEVGMCDLSVDLDIQHPSQVGVNDGSITSIVTGGNSAFTYLWNNGASTESISGLSIGTYTVTVTDDRHCSASANVTLINCHELTVEPQVVLTNPSSCSTADGFIRVLTTDVTGGLSPYTYHWENEGGDNLGDGHLSNQGGGQYCIIVTDAQGCTGSKCFDLVPLGYPEIDYHVHQVACEGGNNGDLEVWATNMEGGLYDFQWDNGYFEQDVNSSRQNGLAAGTYCVTIVSEQFNCEVEKCIELPGIVSNAPLYVTNEVLHPCPNSTNGQVNLTINGGTAPYVVDWEDLFSFPDPEDRTELSKGTYRVTVTDYCGATVVKVMSLLPVDVFKVFSHAGCADQGIAEVLPVNNSGNQPYHITWDNGSTSYIANGLSSGEHCVSITDALGCIASVCLPILNNEYFVEITPPCVGMSDGTITIQISNPDGDATSVLLDGISVYSNELPETFFTVKIPSLLGSTSYTIEVRIGDCVYAPHLVTLGVAPIVQIFDHYNGSDNECVFNDNCNGQVIPGSTTVESPSIDLTDGSGGLFVQCEAPAYCRGTFVEWEDFDKKTVRAAEYEQILAQAWNYGYPAALIDSRTTQFYGLGLADCDKVRFCPTNLKITSITHTIHSGIDANYLEDGCYALDCTPIFPENDNFCTDQLPFPAAFYNGGALVESCNPSSQNLYQLIVWEDALIQTYGGLFTNSELYNKYILPYKTDQRSKCARIVFCQSDFSVLWTDIEQVVCGEYDYLGDLFGFAPGEHWDDCEVYYFFPDNCPGFLCLNPSAQNQMFSIEVEDENGNPQIYTLYGNLERVCPGFPGHFLIDPNDDDSKIVTGCLTGQMHRLSKTISEGHFFPKGIVTCGTEYLFYDYSINAEQDQSGFITNSDFIIDDWDSDKVLRIRPIAPNQSCYVDCHGDEGWSNMIAATQSLQIRYFEKEGEEYVIGGQFIGALSYAGQAVYTQYALSGFVIRISVNGTLISNDLIRNLDPQKPLVFVRGDSGVHLIGGSSSNPLIINGSVYPVQSGYLTDIGTSNSSATVTVVTGKIVFDSTLTIVRATKSLDNTRTTYLFQGKGRILHTGGQDSTINIQDLLLVTCDSSGTVIWTEKINGANVQNNDFDITYGASNNLVIGVTYSDQLQVKQSIINSAGATDIAFALFNPTGELAGLVNYGSADSENISTVFFTDSTLYFGGEFSGSAGSRVIGKHTFQTLEPATSVPYISFLTEDMIETGNLSGKFRSHVDQVANNQLFSLFPNPFTQILTLRVVTSINETIQLQIFSGFGEIIREQVYQVESGDNDFSVITRDFAPGIYFIKVTTASGQSFQQKVVKS